MELFWGGKRYLCRGYGMEAPARDARTYRLIGAALIVHRKLGSGFLEAVYQEAFAIELRKQLIPFDRERELFIHYDGELLGTRYRPDFVAFDQIIVEFKTVQTLLDVHINQTIHYLKASGFRLGLLFNFASERLQWRRVINTPP